MQKKHPSFTNGGARWTDRRGPIFLGRPKYVFREAGRASMACLSSWREAVRFRRIVASSHSSGNRTSAPAGTGASPGRPCSAPAIPAPACSWRSRRGCSGASSSPCGMRRGSPGEGGSGTGTRRCGTVRDRVELTVDVFGTGNLRRLYHGHGRRPPFRVFGGKDKSS